MTKWLFILLIWMSCQWAMADTQEWASLSTEQQALLKPFENQWDSLPVERQQKLLRGAQRCAAPERCLSMVAL